MAKKPRRQTNRQTSQARWWSWLRNKTFLQQATFQDFFRGTSPLAAAWFLLAVLELGLQASIPSSALRTSELPMGARLFLICYSLTMAALFLAIASGFCILFSWASSRFLGGGARLWVTGGFAALLIWLILLFYSASWGLFWQTGSFIDRQTFLFLTPHPLQVFHWVDVDIAFPIIALTIGGTFIICRFMFGWRSRWSAVTQRQIVIAGTWAVGLCIMGAYLGELYSGTEERQYMRPAILYAQSRDNTSGPFAYILSDIRRQIRYDPDAQLNRDAIRLIRRPIISMEQYLDSAADRSSKRWNVIIILVESLRADQLRMYGATRDIMPSVDALARESRVFLNAYTQASHTNYAVVVPLSSHYPLRSGSEHLYPENPHYPRTLIYDVLKPLGYHTAIFSSSNEYWRGVINYLQTPNLDRFFLAANFNGPTYVMEGDTLFAAWVRKTKQAGSVDDAFTTDAAIQWIDSLDTEPFFMAMNLQNSHIPYVVPQHFPRRFGPSKLDFTVRFGHFPRDKVQVVKDVYADSLAYVDSQIDRLFKHLKRRGIWERTVIVLTGDHGQGFYEHGFAAHANAIFDEVMKVPLVIRAPGLHAGLEKVSAQHVDIPPTVSKLLGLTPHPSFQGISLYNSKVNPNRSIYMVTQTPLAFQYGLVRAGFKLIYDERQREYFLYDLASDPKESLDIAATKPALVKELARRLHTWRQLQIDYYADEKLQTREYPPILAD